MGNAADDLYGVASDSIITNAEDCSTWEDDKLLVYTDGSVFNPEYKLYARAGWGIWYGPGSSYNTSNKLNGYTQTSYKAEARALLHVTRTAGVPTCIKCDCLPTVNTFNHILADPSYDTSKCADGEALLQVRLSSEPLG